VRPKDVSPKIPSVSEYFASQGASEELLSWVNQDITNEIMVKDGISPAETPAVTDLKHIPEFQTLIEKVESYRTHPESNYYLLRYDDYLPDYLGNFATKPNYKNHLERLASKARIDRIV